MKKLLFWPYQVYVWLIFLPLAICLTLLFSILTVIFSALVNPDFASRVFAVTWARVVAWLTPIRVRVEGGEHATRSRSFVVASNHQSMYDIPPIIWRLRRFHPKFVSKKECARRSKNKKLPAILLKII